MANSNNEKEIVYNYSIQEMKDKISLGRDLIYLFYNISQYLEKEISVALDQILIKYDREDLKEAIYSSIKELAINGIKANLKHIVFLEENINKVDNESLTRGLSILHNVLNDSSMLEKFNNKVKEKGFRVTLRIKHSNKRVIIVVANSIPLTDKEENRIREKFEKALNYDSIANYYMDNLDDAEAEGAGLGITMIVLLLKSCNISPHAFTIYRNRDNETIAKLEIPLTPDYVSSRDIYQKINK